MITGKRKPRTNMTQMDKNPAKKIGEVLAKSAPRVSVPITENKYPKATRASLMAEAHAKGVKYFRILNRDELQKVLDPNTDAAIAQETIDKAKIRWKAGWGTKKAQVANANA